MSRVAVYNLYWTTYGGGEQVSAAIAECLRDGHDVTLLGPEPIDIDVTRSRLGVDLSGCSWRKVVDDEQAGEASADFDVFVNGTYLSVARNRSSRGLYYVHFPGLPATPRQRVVRTVARLGTKVLSVPPRLPGPMAGVKRGLERRLVDTSWVDTYTTFMANSAYTSSWIRRLWGVDSVVVHPPVRPTVVPGDKTPAIASIGRFFDPSFGHCKKQADLLRGFARMVSSTEGVGGWRLIFVGGADASSRDYALGIRRGAIGLPVDVHLNAPRAKVESTLAGASIFWHAGGFGEDLEAHPDRFEHFGIAVVEAMAAGAVPVVFGAAGPAEIVRHGVDGFHWHTIDELIEHTRRLMDDATLCDSISSAARRRALDFDFGVFSRTLTDVVGQTT
ncbi:MAG: glycosyltransferase family 4 protein [Actinomycetota bacterium]